MAESLVSDLSSLLNENYNGIVAENMIADVLAVCPDVDRSDVTKDLKITGSATRTINRILDGQFPAVVSLDTQSTSSDASSQNKESLKTRQFIPKDCTKPCKLGECSSDTDVYSDTDDDDDDVAILNEERTSLFTALKSRFNNNDNSRMSTTKDLTAQEDINISAQNSSIKSNVCNKKLAKSQKTSEIIDLSSSDDDNVSSEHKSRVARQNTETAGNECVVLGSQKHRIWKTLPSDKDNHQQKFTSTKKCVEKFVDLSQSDWESDSNSDDSTELPCMLPPSCVSFAKAMHQTGSESDKSMSGIDSRTRESTADSDEDSTCRIPCKKKKGSTKGVLHQGKNSLLKKQARDQTQQAKKEEKEKEKQARQLARSQLRNQKEKEKLLKQADKMNQKANRLDTCVKQILVSIDPALLNIGQLEEESVLVQKLNDLGAGYNIKPQPAPASVTWQRTVFEHNVGETLQISTKTSFADEAHAVVRLSALAFVEMVYQFREELNNAISVTAEGDTLRSFCRKALATYSGKIVTIVVLKLEKYFRDVKLAQQRKFRSAALGSSSSDTDKPNGKRRKKSSKETGPSVVVSRVDVEEALVDLQLEEPGCRVRMCETDEEFAELLAMMTKAIAEAPFKKKQPETFSFCVEGGDKGSVKISKDGQGLQKVWQQFFQQFRNVSADVAAAIVAVYPTPQSLLQAYKRCRSKEEASKLLKDILVRRGAGVLATSRRIGPELSRRVHLLFTGEDGQMSMQ